jgi:hypothetical protein
MQGEMPSLFCLAPRSNRGLMHFYVASGDIQFTGKNFLRLEKNFGKLSLASRSKAHSIIMN